MKLVFVDVFDPDASQPETAQIAQNGKVFSGVLREGPHSVCDPGDQAAEMPQRTNVFEEVSLGFGENDAVHPSLIVQLVDLNRIEEAPLTEPRPPSGHQSACSQGLWSLSGRGYLLEDLVQDFRRKGYGHA